MRVLLKIKIDLSTEELGTILKEEIKWIPNLIPKHELLEKKKIEILATVSPDDTPLATETCRYVIHDSETGTWGIVSEPNPSDFDFRLKNDRSDKLKRATEKLVEALSSSHSLNLSGLKFNPEVVVYAPGSPNVSFYGTIIPQGRLRYAIQRRSVEASVGILFLTMALLFSLLTIPPIKVVLFGSPVSAWGQWASDNMGRLSTTGFATFATTWTSIFLYYWRDID